VESQVGSQVLSQVLSQVESQVESQVRSQVGSLILPYLWGHFDAGYFSYVDFMRHIGVRGISQKYDVYESTKKLGFVYPLDKICLVSDRPNEINMLDGVLHRDGGPAVSYLDGTKVWCLNGVRVPKELAELHHSAINPKILLKEKNAEVRREIVRKIGIERICDELNAKCVDSKGDYELLMLDIGDNNIRPYLKMRNPSLGIYHIEGVHPNIRDIDAALKWRNGTDEVPVRVT